MKKIIVIICLAVLVSVSGAYAAPASSGTGDTQSYTAIVPSMAAITEWVAGFTETYNQHGI